MPVSPEFRKRLDRVPPFRFIEPPPAPVAPPPVPDTPEPRRRLPTDETILGLDLAAHAVAALSARERTHHLFAIGKSGQGKSSLLRWLIRQDIWCGRGVILFDPHYDPVAGMGPLVRDVLADVEYAREDDVIVLNLTDDAYPFSLNLFSGEGVTGVNERTVLIDQTVQAFRKAWDGPWGIQMDEWLKVIAHTFMENGHGTMADIPRLLTDRQFRARFTATIANPVVATAWEKATNAKTGELIRESVDSTLRRMNLFLMNPTLANLVDQEQTTLDFARWMAEGRIVLITIPPEKIGKETTQLIGTLLMQLILRAALGRPIDATPFFVYADEFQHFVTPDIPEMIMNVRKHGVGLNLATQTLDNIADDTVRKAVLAVGSLVIYEPTDSDAAILSRGLAHGPHVEADEWRDRPITKQEIITRLANLRAVLGEGCAQCKLPGGERSVRIPFPRDGDTGGPYASVGRIIARSRHEYCRPVVAAPPGPSAPAPSAPAAWSPPPVPRPPTTRRRERLPLDDAGSGPEPF